MQTALIKKDWNSFDLWLWKFFIFNETPIEMQRDAADRCASLCAFKSGKFPNLDESVYQSRKSPTAHNYAWAIREAAIVADSSDGIMAVLLECGLFG